MESRIKSIIQSSIDLKNKVLNDPDLLKTVNAVVEQIINCYENGGKVLFCGNGGSGADAQNKAAEILGKFYFERYPFFV